MECRDCLRVFQRIGEAFNAPLETDELLGLIARVLVEELRFKGCTIRLLSRDNEVLELAASYGLSEKFLAKGPVEADILADALEGRVVHIADCSDDPRIADPRPYQEEGIVSVTTVPLASRDQAIGAIRLGSSDRRTLSDQEIGIIVVVASFCASAIIHSMFHQILGHVAETIRSSMDLDARLRAIAQEVTTQLRSKGCTIQLVDVSGEKLLLKASYGLSDAYLRTVVADPGGGAVRDALDGACVSILDAASDPRIKHRGQVREERIGSIIYVPLTVRGRTIGVLRVYTHRPYEFSEDELNLMRAIGGECALAIQNAQMYAAVKDRYQELVEDFHRWFDHATYPTLPAEPH